MKTNKNKYLDVYCKAENFDKLHKKFVVENYPNQQMKKCFKNNKFYHLHIILPSDKIEVKVLNKTEVLWYCGKHRENDSITMLTINWFPTSLICGVINGRYNENTELAQMTGYVQSFNTGTRSHCFLTSKVKTALETLKSNGFEVE